MSEAINILVKLNKTYGVTFDISMLNAKEVLVRVKSGKQIGRIFKIASISKSPEKFDSIITDMVKEAKGE